MFNKRILISAILGVVLIAGYAYLNRSHPSLVTSPFEKLHVVYRINVLQGHEFDLKLDNGKRVHARLRIGTVPEAKESVIRFLNENLKNRTVYIKVYEKVSQEHAEDLWIVDLIVKTGEGELSLAEWLEEKGLIWN